MTIFKGKIENVKIGIIGLGYVGLPLAIEFAKYFPVVGYDLNSVRIKSLQTGIDSTLEVTPDALAAATNLLLSNESDSLENCNIYIATVPTPIDANKRPDLTPLLSASSTIGALLKKGDLVIYESTVYPGATEEECVPILEQMSSLTFNQHFFVGYSPERINPGDKTHRLPDIKKVTSGSTTETGHFVDSLYQKIITAGTHLAPTIRVAEAAKVIENTQRDLNIALINELALIFHRLGIETLDVLEAAGTKWNFLPFRPGLVGGHCIGVDPYYLTHKAQAVGYHPEIVLAGRRINDGMGVYIASRLIRQMIENDITIKGARVLVMGLTFKENCPDLRNTRVVDVIAELESFHINVDVYDPWIDPKIAEHEYQITVVEPKFGVYDGILIAVSHQEFVALGAKKIREFGKKNAVLADIKGILPLHESDQRL